MATIAAMPWSTVESVFRQGYEAYQGKGPNAECPFHLPGDKRIGVWVAGKDAARRRADRTTALRAFIAREKQVM